MAILDQNPTAREARRLRQQIEIDKLDYRRILFRLAQEQIPQREVSAYLGISQPTLSSNLQTAERTPAPKPGFSGADPYEIAQRYAAGKLTAEQVVDELTRWDYRPVAQGGDDFDTVAYTVKDSFDEVVRALGDGLLEPDVYDAILDAVSKAAAQ